MRDCSHLTDLHAHAAPRLSAHSPAWADAAFYQAAYDAWPEIADRLERAERLEAWAQQARDALEAQGGIVAAGTGVGWGGRREGMIAKAIIYFGQPVTVICDSKCSKAWGINNRPQIEFDPDDPDDTAYLADNEVGYAPSDPGTYEGGQGKPRTPDERLNKWCVRECERSCFVEQGKGIVEVRDFSKRRYNMPWKHTEE